VGRIARQAASLGRLEGAAVRIARQFASRGSSQGGGVFLAMQMKQAPQVMKLTEAAAARVREVLAGKGGDDAALRIGVRNSGCAGMAYTMEVAASPAAGDEVVEDKGVRLAIDPRAVLFLLGTEMDFKQDKLTSGFVFNNPNQVGACGCGESVSLQPAAASPSAPPGAR